MWQKQKTNKIKISCSIPLLCGRAQRKAPLHVCLSKYPIWSSHPWGSYDRESCRSFQCRCSHKLVNILFWRFRWSRLGPRRCTITGYDGFQLRYLSWRLLSLAFLLLFSILYGISVVIAYIINTSATISYQKYSIKKTGSPSWTPTAVPVDANSKPTCIFFAYPSVRPSTKKPSYQKYRPLLTPSPRKLSSLIGSMKSLKK